MQQGTYTDVVARHNLVVVRACWRKPAVVSCPLAQAMGFLPMCRIRWGVETLYYVQMTVIGYGIQTWFVISIAIGP